MKKSKRSLAFVHEVECPIRALKFSSAGMKKLTEFLLARQGPEEQTQLLDEARAHFERACHWIEHGKNPVKSSRSG